MYTASFYILLLLLKQGLLLLHSVALCAIIQLTGKLILTNSFAFTTFHYFICTIKVVKVLTIFMTYQEL